jgi:dihydrofolate reductase
MDMPEIFLSTQVSLDGYAAGPDGDLDWTDVPDAEVDELMAEQLRAIDAMVFGHTAYRLLRPYWQDGPTERAVDREHTALMNSVPKLVLSHGEPDLSWGPAKRIGADLPAEIAELKAGNGRPVAVFAGPQVANALLPYVDEVRLVVYPVILGAGLPLFTTAGPRLRLVETRPFAVSGAVQLRYRALAG